MSRSTQLVSAHAPTNCSLKDFSLIPAASIILPSVSCTRAAETRYTTGRDDRSQWDGSDSVACANQFGAQFANDHATRHRVAGRYARHPGTRPRLLRSDPPPFLPTPPVFPPSLT